jgi:hypothetical protein
VKSILNLVSFGGHIEGVEVSRFLIIFENHDKRIRLYTIVPIIDGS